MTVAVVTIDGLRMYGKVDHAPQLFYVKTVFWHFYLRMIELGKVLGYSEEELNSLVQGRKRVDEIAQSSNGSNN